MFGYTWSDVRSLIKKMHQKTRDLLKRSFGSMTILQIILRSFDFKRFRMAKIETKHGTLLWGVIERRDEEIIKS